MVRLGKNSGALGEETEIQCVLETNKKTVVVGGWEM